MKDVYNNEIKKGDWVKYIDSDEIFDEEYFNVVIVGKAWDNEILYLRKYGTSHAHTVPLYPEYCGSILIKLPDELSCLLTFEDGNQTM